MPTSQVYVDKANGIDWHFNLCLILITLIKLKERSSELILLLMKLQTNNCEPRII